MRSDRRAVSPPLAAVLLIVITVALAGVVAAGVGSLSPGQTGPNAVFEVTIDGESGEVAIEHVAGDPVDVEELSIVAEVDGDELAHQPPVPFVGAEGFYGTPDGPFNAEADQEWTAGEHASFRVAGTNEPTIEPGNEVVLTLAVDGHTIARLEATAA
ncbi:type IV pilin [Natrialbaceae archaeon A-gly3]